MNDLDLKLEEEILNKIQNRFGHEIFKPGLLRTQNLYGQFKQIFKAKSVKIITVAGTNGKGQTCHTLSYLLNQKKINSALWTSPHIVSIRERFRYNDQEISYSELEQLINICENEVLNLEISISFYEFIFYVFLKWICNKKLDFIIFEVGIGGRFDSVNHFDCDLAVITSISRDHQSLLGNTYDKILNEKLGICRQNVPLLTTFKLNYLIEKTLRFTQNNKIEYLNFDFSKDYFVSNILLAEVVCKKVTNLEFNVASLPQFKGREEVLKWGKLTFCFIGAHNPEGMRETFEKLKNIGNEQKILISFSNRSVFDLKIMLNTLLAKKDKDSEVILTLFDHPKAISRDILEDVLVPFCNNRVNYISDWKCFLNGIKNQSSDQKILVIGSYYFIGEVQRFLFSNQ